MLSNNFNLSIKSGEIAGFLGTEMVLHRMYANIPISETVISKES